MPSTLGLKCYVENAALEVAETFAVSLSYHNPATLEGKSLTRKWRGARACLAPNHSSPSYRSEPLRSRRGLELSPKTSSFSVISWCWEAYDSAILPHGDGKVVQSIATTASYHVAIIYPSKRPGQTAILGRVSLPRGFSIPQERGIGLL
jgi:hypothetical protein